jgi:hypothetical protein
MAAVFPASTKLLTLSSRLQLTRAAAGRRPKAGATCEVLWRTARSSLAGAAKEAAALHPAEAREVAAIAAVLRQIVVPVRGIVGLARSLGGREDGGAVREKPGRAEALMGSSEMGERASEVGVDKAAALPLAHHPPAGPLHAQSPPSPLQDKVPSLAPRPGSITSMLLLLHKPQAPLC